MDPLSRDSRLYVTDWFNLYCLDPARRAVARVLPLGHPARHLLVEDGAILVVDQGLKEYGTAAR